MEEIGEFIVAVVRAFFSIFGWNIDVDEVQFLLNKNKITIIIIIIILLYLLFLNINSYYIAINCCNF